MTQQNCKACNRPLSSYRYEGMPLCSVACGAKWKHRNEPPRLRRRGAVDLVGQRFTRLLVLSHYVDRWWLCRCDCGATRIVETCKLRSGKTRSCGCWHRDDKRERQTRHGHTGRHADGRRRQSKLYSAHKSMLYRNAGRVAEVWIGKNGFDRFARHVGEPPSQYHRLRRIRPNGLWGPGNVAWVPRSLPRSAA